MIRPTELGFTSILMEQYMKVIGEMIYSMAMVSKPGPTIANILGNISMARNKVKDDTTGAMEAFLMENG